MSNTGATIADDFIQRARGLREEIAGAGSGVVEEIVLRGAEARDRLTDATHVLWARSPPAAARSAT